MCKSILALEKYWVNQSYYFRLVTTVTLGVRIKYGKILFCHDISEVSEDKFFSTIEYNGRTVYDCFNNTFPDDCVSPALNIPPINVDDI